MIAKSSLAIIIPCYNEELAIPDFCQEMTEFIKSFNSEFENTDLKIVFVDNMSTDQSLQKLLNYAAEPVQIVRCSVPGYGAALKMGFEAVQADWYGFADLDNTYPLESFLQMYRLAQSGKFSIIYGNRLQLVTKMPWVRKVGNLFYVKLAQLLFKNAVNDMCTGMRLFSQEKKQHVVGLMANDLKFSMALTALSLKQNWPRIEIPILYRERLGKSKLSVVKDGVLFLAELLKVKFVRSSI